MMISICLIVVLLAAGSIGFQVCSKRDFIVAELFHADSYLSQVDNSLKSPTSLPGMMLRESTKSNTSLDGVNKFNLSSIHDIDARDIESAVFKKGGCFHIRIHTGGQEKRLVLYGGPSTLMFGDPCDGCHHQNEPRFRPTPTTKENFPFESTECRLLGSYRQELMPLGGVCGYRRDEGRLNAHGVLSRVMSCFGSSSGSGTEGGQFNLWFSRVFKSEKDTLGPSVQGLVGLYPGPYSLITQLAEQLKIPKKFSYCLHSPYSKSSETSTKIIFGEKTSISTEKVTTPFVTKYAKSSYYLSLRAITVYNQSKKMTTLIEGHDNIVMVPHTKTTHLPRQTYNHFVENIKSLMDDVGDVYVVPHEEYSLCYDNVTYNMLPKIRLEFDNGAILKLPRLNTYVQFFNTQTACMTIEPTEGDDLPEIGTHAQADFAVEYDLHNSEISFANADCDKFGIQ